MAPYRPANETYNQQVMTEACTNAKAICQVKCPNGFQSVPDNCLVCQCSDKVNIQGMVLHIRTLIRKESRESFPKRGITAGRNRVSPVPISWLPFGLDNAVPITDLFSFILQKSALDYCFSFTFLLWYMGNFLVTWEFLSNEKKSIPTCKNIAENDRGFGDVFI